MEEKFAEFNHLLKLSFVIAENLNGGGKEEKVEKVVIVEGAERSVGTATKCN